MLVSSKLQPQPFRHGLLQRSRLIRQLGQISAGGLTLVAAPAGFGKTTLLSEWRSAEAAATPFAWLTLDPADNDPSRFWAYVLAALERVLPQGTGRQLGRISPGRGDWLGDLLPTLVNTLAEADGRVILVLDDYHAIGDRSIHDGVAFVVEQLPPSAHIVIATRADPPLPLARLRARGLLTEMRAADLRFAAEEAQALLNDRLGLELSEEEIGRLHGRTEGWAAGLYLAGLSLQQAPDRTAFVDAFSGDDRHIVDFLGQEVLDAQTPETRAFLLSTSILDRLCGPLCDALLGAEGSSRVLQDIEGSNLFLVPLDTRRQWYRYHQLFAELLRYELARSGRPPAAELHRRASDWHAAHGTPEEAIGHALAAGDAERARDLVRAHWVSVFNSGQLATISGWLDALPQELVVTDGDLCVARAWVALDLGAVDQAAPWVERAETAVGRSPETAVLRAVHRFKSGDVSAAAHAAAEAVAASSDALALSRTAAQSLVGITSLWSGHAALARSGLAEALALASRSDNDLASAYALGYQATLQALEGAFPEAESLARAARRLRDDAGFSSHFVLSIADSAYAAALLGQGRADEAQEPARRSLELAERGGSRVEIAFAQIIAARVGIALGDVAEGAALLARTRLLVATFSAQAPLLALVEQAEDEARRRRPVAAAAGDPLTPQELAVLRLLPEDLSLREIGDRLYVSLNTVKTHVRAVYRKLGASTRSEAVALGRAAGVLDRRTALLDAGDRGRGVAAAEVPGGRGDAGPGPG